jgi:hypothetical protein
VQLVDIVFPPTQAILKNDVGMRWKWFKDHSQADGSETRSGLQSSRCAVLDAA